MSCKKIYITTPIYYVNDAPHIGHAYTTVIADMLAIYSRLKGYDTYFLTGTDEHGQKIEESAKKRGKNPKEYADEISRKFKALWDDFDISYDYFIRTTDAQHKKGVQKAFSKMHSQGDIYKGEYEGCYCVSCETFFTKKQLIDEELCPECGKETRIIKEESYFFALSKYQERLLAWYEENPDCILPKSKRNEVINFVKEGLNDLSITRTGFDWGVKLPEEMGDPKHVMYVWLDALLNYVTALGYGDDEKLMDFWPAKLHLLGKDILRFHAIYWPAFLMSLELPLPSHIAAHGWWTRDGAKMSKSKGNVIDPKEVADAYGLEPFRYFMIKEVPFGQDGDFSQKAMIDRINSDLGNDLGNLLNRTIGMAHKYFGGKIDSIDMATYHKEELERAAAILDGLPDFIHEMQTNRYLEELWKILGMANQSVTKYEPWVLMKEGREREAMALLALVANLLAGVTLALHPVMPKTTEKIAKALKIACTPEYFRKIVEEKSALESFEIEKTEPLFPRIEAPLLKSAPRAEELKEEQKKSEAEGLITIDKFFESQIKVGKVVEVKEVEGSDKLLQLKVDLGEGRLREVVAGIKKYYAPDALVDTQVCVVANLKPAKIMGLLSEGMILAAKDKKGLSLIRPEAPKKIGTKIS